MKTARITPAQTCKLRGVDPQTERAFIRSGKCPYAVCYIPEGAKTFSYVVFPGKLYEYFGKEFVKESGVIS